MNTWADNADALSLLYSGTPALKTDFTRTGRTTISGRLADGYNAVSRWVVGNFEDGHTQDAWDVASGAVRFQNFGSAGGIEGSASVSGSAAAASSAGGAERAGLATKGSAGVLDVVSAEHAGRAIRAHGSSLSPTGFLLRSALLIAMLAAMTATSASVAHAHTAGAAAATAAAAATGFGLLPWPVGYAEWDTTDLSRGLLPAAASALLGLVHGSSVPGAGAGSGPKASLASDIKLTSGAVLCGAVAALFAMGIGGWFVMKKGIPSVVTKPSIRALPEQPRLDRDTSDFDAGASASSIGRAKQD
jgi:hypothetical protein